MSRKQWTVEEDNLLKSLYMKDKTDKEIAAIMDRTTNSISNRIKVVGLPAKYKRPRYKDLTGIRFGRLVVLKEAGRDYDGHVMWECQCDCGNICVTSGKRLLNGTTKSCGCFAREMAFERKFKDITGQRFGKLIALRWFKNEDEKITWECKCDCGNTTYVSSGNLLSGHTKSCGCLQKEKNNEAHKKYNEYYICGDIVFVKFINYNEYFLCDLEDWDNLKEYCWYKDIGGYAVSLKHKKTIRFHRIVMNCKDGEQIDHDFQVSNGVCDNRKSNLRICDNSKNGMNHTMRSDNKSGVIGVSWSNERNKWVSQIVIDGDHKYLGRFINFEDAVKTRLKAEKEYFKEFAPQKHLFKKYGVF